MLQIEVPMSPEEWDERKQEFVIPKTQVLKLEHSLISISKWESKYHKPFLGNNELTSEEVMDYIKFMTINSNVDSDIYNHLTSENVQMINNYIGDSMTATTFSDNRAGKKSREIITSELIYYWMIALQIPSDYDKWHINRLLTLIRICNIKNESPKKMSKREIMSRNASLNAARRKQLNTKG